MSREADKRRGLMDESQVPCEVSKGLARVGRTVIRYEHLTYAIARICTFNFCITVSARMSGK